MFHPLNNLYSFMAEAEEFRVFIERIPGNQRALSLASAQDMDAKLRFFPNWYQSLNNGWVDFNYAGSLAQIVRFRPEKLPEVRLDNLRSPEFFMSMKRCDIYDLVFIYADSQLDEQALSATPCSAHKLYGTSGNWHVFKRVDNTAALP
jgi:hypothetical protein